MEVIRTDAYRAASARYLRTGAPIHLSLKQARPTPRYVWRTRGDEKVRVSHRRNGGRIFEGANPPEIDVDLSGGTSFLITGRWTANFSAEVFNDESHRQFIHDFQF